MQTPQTSTSLYCAGKMQDREAKRPARNELPGLVLLFSHVRWFAKALQFLHFRGVFPGEHVPIGRTARVVAVPNQDFQTETPPKGNESSVGLAAAPDPRGYND